MKHVLILLFFFGIGAVAVAQDDSVTTVEKDSSFIEETLEEYGYSTQDEEKEFVALPDSTIIIHRSFSQEQIESLKNERDLQYKETPTIAESLWSRILRWIKEFILYLLRQILDEEGSVNWVKLVFYILGIAVIVLVIMMLLKVNAFKVFYSGEGAAADVKHNIIDENIHAMDFEKLIQEARDQKDYRRAVRLVFLFSLKMLADKHLIAWEQGKTNHDYVAELKQAELKNGLNELSFYFDYAWYGNFSINAETFAKVQTVFSEWRTKVR